MNETLLTPSPSNSRFILSGIYNKEQLKSYISSFPNFEFQENCSVLNNSTGTAIRYGRGDNSDWEIDTVPVCFSFECSTPKKIHIKGIYTDTGKSIFMGGFVFKDSNNTYTPLWIADSSSMSVTSGGIYIKDINNQRQLVVGISKTFVFDYTWINTGYIPKGNYTFSYKWELNHIQGDGINVTVNPTYFDILDMEF